MSLGRLLSPTDVSASGLAAERLRMKVVAHNIANAYSTCTPGGGPDRRRQVVFAALDEALASDGAGRQQLARLQVLGVQPDVGELPRVYQPGHPDSDAEGDVKMPNVQTANEMVDLITASRVVDRTGGHAARGRGLSRARSFAGEVFRESATATPQAATDPPSSLADELSASLAAA